MFVFVVFGLILKACDSWQTGQLPWIYFHYKNSSAKFYDLYKVNDIIVLMHCQDI
jgi:hypothetical protein